MEGGFALPFPAPFEVRLVESQASIPRVASTSPSAIKDLADMSDERLLPAISEGVEHLVANFTRLHDAATSLANAGDHMSAVILGSIATEEASKVLILLDAVRCPPSKREERRRTLDCWNSHLWKGLYSNVCDGGLAHRNFGQVEGFIERESAHFYLDGPIGVDWAFPNRIPAERERRMYVDFVRDITEGNDEPPWWSTPSTYRHYSPSACLYTADALARLGVTRVEGLEVVAETWRGFEPKPHTSQEELNSLIRKMLRGMEMRGISEPERSDPGVMHDLYQWPFPLWSLAHPVRKGSEREQQFHDIQQEREHQLELLREVERVRDPAITISPAKVEELHSAFLAHVADRGKHETKLTVDEPGGLRVRASTPGYAEQSAPYQALKGLWRELSEDERLALTALAIFTRDQVADWAASYASAKRIVAINNERYQIHLGSEWLEGLSRYEADPPRRD